MTRATLLALADRVEALTGPCRKTDAEICRAIGWRNRDGFWWEPADPGYTASLDAAMALVPKGVTGIHLWQAAYGYECTLLSHDGPIAGSNGNESRALALTAAALRARAMMETD